MYSRKSFLSAICGILLTLSAHQSKAQSSIGELTTNINQAVYDTMKAYNTATASLTLANGANTQIEREVHLKTAIGSLISVSTFTNAGLFWSRVSVESYGVQQSFDKFFSDMNTTSRIYLESSALRELANSSTIIVDGVPNQSGALSYNDEIYNPFQRNSGNPFNLSAIMGDSSFDDLIW